MSADFLFLTRTREQDYRVFKNSGELAGDEQEKIFMDNLRYSGITGTENPFVVLNEDNGKFYIISGGMKTGGVDREGRPVRFSFFYELDDRDEALRSFLTLASKWDESTNFMHSCLDAKRGKIIFSHLDFLNWLKSSQHGNVKLNLKNNPAKSKSLWLNILFGLALLIICGLIFYTNNLRASLEISRNKYASLTTKIDELREIHSSLSGAFDLMGSSYTYMDMMSEDAKLAAEYSRREADKAKVLINDAGNKIMKFRLEEAEAR